MTFGYGRRISLRVEQGSQAAGDVDLAGVRAELVDVTVKGPGRALENLERESGHHVGLFGNQLTSVDRFGSKCRDHLRPVDQCQSLSKSEMNKMCRRR
jgi:hypothetical protein